VDNKSRFWLSGKGLIRQNGLDYPDIWLRGGWRVGSAYLLDAISGMGEDPYSCGEYADQLTVEQAEEYAAKHRIDLHGKVKKD